jgi:hypothetical protein
MSRGYGYMQTWLVHKLADGRPKTFDAILAEDDVSERASVRRSLRRALKKLVDDGTVIPLGWGGPSDPHRYAIHPTLLKSKRKVASLMRHLKPEGFFFNDDGKFTVSLHSIHAHRRPGMRRD